MVLDKIDIVLDYEIINKKCDQPTNYNIKLLLKPLKSLVKI